MKAMATCKVCGRDFALIIEEHYIARDHEKTGLIPALSGQDEATIYDAFDCPHCGSQYIAQERKFNIDTDDEESEDEESEDDPYEDDLK